MSAKRILPKLISIEQAADLLGCSKPTARKIIRENGITITRLGNRLVRYHRDEIVELIDKRSYKVVA